MSSSWQLFRGYASSTLLRLFPIISLMSGVLRQMISLKSLMVLYISTVLMVSMISAYTRSVSRVASIEPRDHGSDQRSGLGTRCLARGRWKSWRTSWTRCSSSCLRCQIAQLLVFTVCDKPVVSTILSPLPKCEQHDPRDTRNPYPRY